MRSRRVYAVAISAKPRSRPAGSRGLLGDLVAHPHVEVEIRGRDRDEGQRDPVDDPRDEVEPAERISVTTIRTAPTSGPAMSASAAPNTASDPTLNHSWRTRRPLLLSELVADACSNTTTGAISAQRTASTIPTGSKTTVEKSAASRTDAISSAPSSGLIETRASRNACHGIRGVPRRSRRGPSP